MKWYGGNIVEAIQKSKAEGAVFVVAIIGEDEGSQQLESSLKSGEVQNIIQGGKFVSIRLTAESPEHLQFAQIYQNASAASVYLIGEQGLVLETISATDSCEEKFRAAWSRHAEKTKSTARAQSPSTSQNVNPSSSTISQPSAEIICNSIGNALEEANKAVSEAEVAANQENLTLEEKVERAQKLAAAKRQQKLAMEAEEERQKERERRNVGRGVAELKRWQEEQEAKQLLEQRKKDKKEEQELRKKLREQIAQDRAARNAVSNTSFITDGPRTNNESTSGSFTSKNFQPVSTAPKDFSGQTRLQFRLPSGSSISHPFDPQVSLGDVRNFLISNNHVPFRNFTMSLAYPRRQFDSSDYLSTLSDLGLIPSAALLILPLTYTSSFPAAKGGIGGWISIIFGYIMIPISFIFSFLRRALPSTPTNGKDTSIPKQNTPSTSSPSPQPTRSVSSTKANTQRDSSLRNRKAAKNADALKTEGNIRRFRTSDDSDDEKATWNGNSTQQM